MVDFVAARHHMVDSQIRTNKVTNPDVIDAMEEIPRERFVDKSHQGIAYLDEDLPIGNGRFLMEPMILARMLQTLDLQSGDIVLDVGVATGYSSAVISRLASTVIALESDPSFASQTTLNMAELGIDNVVLVEGALADGYPAQAPYDVIVLEGAVPEVPTAITDQLADGGRLCAVIDENGTQGRAVLMVRSGDVVSRRVVFDANTPSLPGFEKAQGFVF